MTLALPISIAGLVGTVALMGYTVTHRTVLWRNALRIQVVLLLGLFGVVTGETVHAGPIRTMTQLIFTAGSVAFMIVEICARLTASRSHDLPTRD